MKTEADAYKLHRLTEMACTWKGKSFEPYTIPILAMLIQENGALSSDRWHDCYPSGNCHALPLTGYNICARGGPDGIHYCTWAGGKPAHKRFEAKHPKLATDWRAQFYHFSDQIRGFAEKGTPADKVIMSWNPREHNRLKKVARWKNFVRLAIGQEPV